MRTATWLLAMWWLVGAGSRETGDGSRESAVHLSRLPNGLLAAPVTINGTGPYWMLFDTGSVGTILGPEAAVRAGVRVTAGGRVLTPSGARDAGVAVLESLALGPLGVSRLPVLVLPVDHLKPAAARLDGVIGNDVLGRANYHLDPAGRVLTMDLAGRLAPAFAAGAQPVVREGGRVLVTGTIGAGPEVAFVVDSGASLLVVFSPMNAGGRPVPARTAGGVGVGWHTKLPRVRVGGVEWTDVDALTLPPQPGRVGHALLPLTRFASVYVNNRDGWVAFNATSSRGPSLPG